MDDFVLEARNLMTREWRDTQLQFDVCEELEQVMWGIHGRDKYVHHHHQIVTTGEFQVFPRIGETRVPDVNAPSIGYQPIRATRVRRAPSGFPFLDRHIGGLRDQKRYLFLAEQGVDRGLAALGELHDAPPRDVAPELHRGKGAEHREKSARQIQSTRNNVKQNRQLFNK